MDLKLPEIEPARVVPSAADAIDRAGAKFKQAADSVGEALLKPEMAKITVASQEASIQRSREEAVRLDTIKKNPYVTVEKAKELFPNGLPAGVKTTEPDGSPRIIPMSELAVAYFDQEAPGVTDRAAEHISAPGWRQRFKLAAQEDSARKRAEVVELQRNLQLADNELKSKLQYDQEMAARNFAGAEAILASDVTIGEVERRKMRDEHPMKKTMAVVLDRLQSGDVKELDSLISDLTANEVKPENGIYTTVPAERRYLLLRQARDAKNDVLAAEERARKAAKEARFQAEFDKVQQAAANALASNGSVTDFYPASSIPIDFDDTEYRSIREAITADPARVSDPRIEIGVAEMQRTPGLLGNQSAQWVLNLRPKLSEKKWEETYKAWSQDRADSTKTKPPVPEFAVPWINDAVDYAMGGADAAKNDSVGALALKAQLYTNVAARLRKDPNGLEPKEVYAMGVRARSGGKVSRFGGSEGVPDGARIIIVNAAKGGALSEPMIRAEYQKAKKQEDDLKRAWLDVMGEDPETSPPFDDSALMDMYYRVTKDEAGLRARAKARLPDGATVDARQIRYQAALEQAPEGTAEGRAQREADAEKVAAQRQVEERRVRLEKAAKGFLTGKNRPPELAAEFSRIAGLVGTPKPGTSYNYTVEDMKELQEKAAFDYAAKIESAGFIGSAHGKGK